MILEKRSKKFILVSLLTVLLLNSFQLMFSQQLPPEKRIYQEVIVADGISQKQLFDITSRWMITNPMVNSVYEDNVNYTIVGSGYIISGFWNVSYEAPTKYAHVYSLVVEVKEEKVRFTFSRIYISTVGKLAKQVYKKDLYDMTPESSSLGPHVNEVSSQEYLDLIGKYIHDEILTDFQALVEKEQDEW